MKLHRAHPREETALVFSLSLPLAVAGIAAAPATSGASLLLCAPAALVATELLHRPRTKTLRLG